MVNQHYRLIQLKHSKMAKVLLLEMVLLYQINVIYIAITAEKQGYSVLDILADIYNIRDLIS